MLANKVSPPWGGTSRDQHRPHRRAFEIGGVAVPEPAEIDPLVLELDDRGDQRKALDTLDERVFDDLTKTPGEGEKPLGQQVLAAKEDYQMVEPGAPDRGDRRVVEVCAKIDPGDLGPERAGNRMDLKRAVGHHPMIF